MAPGHVCAARAEHDGQQVATDQVISWDGKVIHQTQWPGPMIGGFLEHGPGG